MLRPLDLDWLPDHLREELAEQLLLRATNAAGEPVCACGAVLNETQLACVACATRERIEYEQRQRLKHALETLRKCVDCWLEPVPVWAWARAGDPRFAERVGHPRLQGAAAKWLPEHRNLVLLGPTGCGKTSAAIAIAHRLAEHALAETAKGIMRISQTVGFLWTNGDELVAARRKCRLGAGEAPLVERAIGAPVLIIDEVGYEVATDRTLAEIIDARYRREAPTIVTSGLTVAEFAGRYGDALWRRLAQRGSVIECWVAAGG